MIHCRFTWACTYICSLRNAILCLCMYIRNACAIQSYARVCISVTLAQCLHNNETKLHLGGGDNCGLSRGRFTQQVTIASFGHWLLNYIALTAALVRYTKEYYTKDKGAFITARQRVGQIIKDLRHSEYAHGRYISSEMPWLMTVTTAPALGPLWIVQKERAFECANIGPMLNITRLFKSAF